MKKMFAPYRLLSVLFYFEIIFCQGPIPKNTSYFALAGMWGKELVLIKTHKFLFCSIFGTKEN